jgi:FG-GAP-like repeat/Abnormal spindle-like microcephaly-assoc'd, ASPM-SPD-2-Hydin
MTRTVPAIRDMRMLNAMATNFMRRALSVLVGALLGLTLLAFTGAANAQRMTLESLAEPGRIASRSWVDVNNDGKDDYCLFVGNNDGLRCYVSTGSTFNATPLAYSVGSAPDLAIWWVDVNGDGRVDLCRQTTLVWSGTARVQCRLGPSFTTAFELAVPSYVNEGCPGGDACTPPPVREGMVDSGEFFLADVDVDGRTDICYHHMDVNGALSMRCALSTGTGFATPTGAWIRPIASLGSSGWTRGFFDVDGDGYPDFCFIENSIQCVLGTANGLSSGANYDSPSLSAVNNHKEGAAFVDINGDGKTDFCRITGPSAGNYRLSCRISTGKGWESTDRTTSLPISEGSKYNRWWVDINGDGLADFCRAVGPEPSDFVSPSINKNSNLWCRLSRGGDATSGLFAVDDLKLEASTTHGYVNFGVTNGGRGFCDAHGTGVQTFCRATYRDTAPAQCWESEYGPYCEAAPGAHGIAVGVYAAIPADPNTSDSIVVADPEVIQSKQPLLSAFSDGLGAETRLTYLSLTSERVYDRTFGNEKWPRIQIPVPRSPVVFETRAWRKGTQTTLTGNARYAYRDLRVDNQTGSRGFRERWQLNEGANTLEHFIYYQGLGPTVDASSVEYGMLEVGSTKESKVYAIDPSKITPSTSAALVNDRQRLLEATIAKARVGIPNAMSTSAISPTTAANPFMLLRRTVNTLGTSTPANPLLRPVVSSSMSAWDWNGSTAVALPSVFSTSSIDDVGNVMQLVETTTHAGQEWKKTTTNTYADDRTKHFLGRLKTAQVVSTAPTADVQLAANTRSYGGSPNANTVSSSNGAAAPLAAPAFVSTQVGQSSTADSTLTNTMASPLVIVPPAASSVTGQDFAFVATTCGSSLPANGTCTISVRFTPTAASTRTGSVFIDTASGLRSAAFTANSLASFSTATLISAPPNLGNVWYGSSPAPGAAVSFRNDGNSAMTLTGLTGLSSRFTLSNNTCAGIAPAASCSMTITMPTSAAGSGANTVTTAGATTNATFDINGAVNSAVSRWSVTTLVFGNVTVGLSSTLSLSLFNDGFGLPASWNAALTNLPAGFTANTSTCASVSPGASCTVSITFTPTAGQNYSGSSIRPATVSFTGNTLAVSGAGVLPATTITAPASVSFGTNLLKGTYVTKGVTITNSGTVAATGMGYAITAGGGFPGYTVSRGTCPAAGGMLAAGASCTLSVAFESSCSGGSYNGTLSIMSANLSAARTVSLTASVRTTGICGA